MKKLLATITTLVFIISACHKTATNPTVDPRLTAHYMFKPGTYWVYAGGPGIDSQIVIANGTANGLPYMQIHECLNGHHRDTIYIGVGPAYNQLQIWGYDFLTNTSAQTIFEADTPIVGTTVAQGLVYAGINNNGSYPYGITASFLNYTVLYSQSNRNEEYGDVDYFFYPDYGIVQKTEYSTPSGDIFWNMLRCHIIQ